MSSADAHSLRVALEHSVATGTRFALLFVTVMIAGAAVVSSLIPRQSAQHRVSPPTDALDGLESVIA